jgi:hypothetical protein
MCRAVLSRGACSTVRCAGGIHVLAVPAGRLVAAPSPVDRRHRIVVRSALSNPPVEGDHLEL